MGTKILLRSLQQQAGTTSKIQMRFNFLTWHWKMPRLLPEVRAVQIIVMTLRQ